MRLQLIGRTDSSRSRIRQKVGAIFQCNSAASRLAVVLSLLPVCMALSTTTVRADATQQTSISIIIDDLGNNLALGQRALSLPGPVTFALLPHSTYGNTLAREANNAGKEIMLHMPMDNNQDRPLGPGGLTGSLDRTQFNQRIHAAFDAFPNIQGVNNHMGSRLTQDWERMDWFMRQVKERPLYFLDSRTSANTVAAIVAVRHQIPSLKRDVFLDNDPSPAAIHRQFKKLITLAKKNGSAVAIGHPYTTTLGYLENVLPKLDAMGIKLVSPSGLLAIRGQQNLSSQTAYAVASPEANSENCRLTEEADATRIKCG